MSGVEVRVVENSIQLDAGGPGGSALNGPVLRAAATRAVQTALKSVGSVFTVSGMQQNGRERGTKYRLLFDICIVFVCGF